MNVFAGMTGIEGNVCSSYLSSHPSILLSRSDPIGTCMPSSHKT